MDWVVTIAAALVVWSALRVLGNERQRRLDEQTAVAAAQAASPSAPNDNIPVVS